MAVDIANTAVARGKIYLARQRGEAIPDSWALTPEGEMTTDAAEAVHGVILPMAGHKGYAIAFMMDILSGILTGSKSGKGVNGPYEADKPSGCGHMFLAIDVETLGSPQEFQDRVRGLIEEVKATPLAKHATDIFYPGEIEDRNAARVQEEGGLVLPEQTLADLCKLAAEAGVDASILR